MTTGRDPQTYRCPICAQRITLHVTPSAPPTCSRGHRPRQMAREEES